MLIDGMIVAVSLWYASVIPSPVSTSSAARTGTPRFNPLTPYLDYDYESQRKMHLSSYITLT